MSSLQLWTNDYKTGQDTRDTEYDPSKDCIEIVVTHDPPFPEMKTYYYRLKPAEHWCSGFLGNPHNRKSFTEATYLLDDHLTPFLEELQRTFDHAPHPSEATEAEIDYWKTKADTGTAAQKLQHRFPSLFTRRRYLPMEMIDAEELGRKWITDVRTFIDEHRSQKPDEMVLCIEAPSASSDP